MKNDPNSKALTCFFLHTVFPSTSVWTRLPRPSIWLKLAHMIVGYTSTLLITKDLMPPLGHVNGNHCPGGRKTISEKLDGLFGIFVERYFAEVLDT